MYSLAAELMNNLSSIILQAAPEPSSKEKLAQSEAWGRKALAVANAALVDCPPVPGHEGTVGRSDGCAVAKAVILYNLGYIREVGVTVVSNNPRKQKTDKKHSNQTTRMMP